MQIEDTKQFDVIIIGAGPAGMMAAISASEPGASVALLEKNNSLGKKLLITGGQRCNITKAEFNIKEFAKKYEKEGDFLLNALSIFGPKETIEFFEKNKLKTKIEEDNKVFPKSDKSTDVLNVLVNCLKSRGVQIFANSEIKEIKKDNPQLPNKFGVGASKKISSVILSDGTEIFAKNYIICTGGMSYPITGSTGDGYKWAKELGHNIEKTKPALTPITIKEEWAKKAQGLSLQNVELTIFKGNKKKNTITGDIIFTHFGLSGPAILNASKNISDYLEKSKVKISLDLNPNLSLEELDEKIQFYFSKNINKTFKNCLLDILPPKMAPIIIELSGIEGTKKTNIITKKERQKLVKLLKNLEMNVASLLGFDQAIITSGGVSLKEIDAKTMKSKLIDNLFFAGEVINLHGPTGGYNLQVCWSTGFVAGQNSAKIQ